ncbi:IS110 family transposase [Microtetraspora malaysiensis]|uniref:IS110 family transposase n=1 Tax=Microtetraspora malaysiensis TaxID=161358 RepID=UPI003D932845
MLSIFGGSVLFVGDDWAEEHHDVEVQDEAGKVLKRVRLPEGIAGISRFHELVARFVAEDAEPSDVLVCIETDRGPWVRALRAAGYRVFGVDPKQAARHREILSSSGAKSDRGDAHALADMVRTRHHQLLEVAGDSEIAEAVKVVTRAHQTLLWERTRHMLRLRVALRDYFPAALDAYKPLGLTSEPVLKLLAKAPTSAAAAKLTISQISAALKGRRDIAGKAAAIQQSLRGEHLGQSGLVTAAYASTVRALVAVITTLNAEISTLESEVEAHFGRHPDAEIILSQPGIGVVLGARVLAEFGDAPGRYTSAKARKNYAGTSPITRQSGKMRTVHARFVHNDRLVDALHLQASCAILHDSEVRAYYDQTTAWSHRSQALIA